MADENKHGRLLAADLDGTLHQGDLAWHCCARLLARKPWLLLNVLFWLSQGRLMLKTKIAQRITTDPADLKWNDEVIDFLRKQGESGQPLALATAAMQGQAEHIAEYLAREHNLPFDYLLGSTADINRLGHAKADGLRELGEKHGGFDYIGDSPAQDPPVFDVAHTCHLVNPTEDLKEKYGQGEHSHVFVTSHGLFKALRRRFLALVQVRDS